MKSTLEVGGSAYKRATKRITMARAFDSMNERPLQTPTDEQISSWLAEGGACLRIIPVRRLTGQVPGTFRVMLDGAQFLITNPSRSATLLSAGEHVVASATRATLGRYYAVVHLAAGEDVELQFRSGVLDAQTGGGWTGLSAHSAAAG